MHVFVKALTRGIVACQNMILFNKVSLSLSVSVSVLYIYIYKIFYLVVPAHSLSYAFVCC